MKIFVFKEKNAGEKRVALTPDGAKKLIKNKHDIIIESGAGLESGYTDSEYEAAGAKVGSIADGDIVLTINKPENISLKAGQTIVSLLYPLSEPALVKKLAEQKVTSIAVDMIPRTTLAQSMDVLSSQANLAGYWAVLAAASRLPKIFPMLMTAAGTITPAKVLILGAGVAGLQAIATARRLGAVVEVFDVRKVVKEQVQSLGAKFVEVDSAEDAAGSGGYAKEASAEYQAKQKELIKKHVAKSDVAITTALIPGKKAPILITADMVASMRPGSIVVDLAAEQGGNVEGCEAGKIADKNGVKIVGITNATSELCVHASQMYSTNMVNLLNHLCDKEGKLNLDMQDEIIAGSVIIKDGVVVHPKVSG
ncbi:Re/Si-specific NAD(P)(+) transhydrogenase subunit alpha [bacterium]|nr:Re/Si-specific NAD(P)(+) transhydrogenase subunit alpha [bacterium]